MLGFPLSQKGMQISVLSPVGYFFHDIKMFASET